MGHEGRSWLDRCRLYRDRLIASPRVQRWALANPVTRPGVRHFVRAPALDGRGAADSYRASLQHGIPMTTGRRIPIGWVAADLLRSEPTRNASQCCERRLESSSSPSASYYVLDIAYIIVFLGSLFSREFAGVTGLVLKARRERRMGHADLSRTAIPVVGRRRRRWPRLRSVADDLGRPGHQHSQAVGRRRKSDVAAGAGAAVGIGARLIQLADDKGAVSAIGRPTNRLDCKSRPERACNCAAVKAASCSDGTATDCTSLMRHMVIEIHWSDGGTLSN